MNILEGARVAITGAAGTVGRGIVDHLLKLNVAEVRALDNGESELADLDLLYGDDDRYHAFLCDIRSSEKLNGMFRSMDYVIHAAALKHVPLCERSPIEAIQTNIIGLQNVIQAATANRVQKVLFTSSDKAVNPTNVMGTSKLMGERLMTAANAVDRDPLRTVFLSTRFGNIAGSSGSVIPLVCKQIERGGPITLTDSEMTRFIMSLDEAVRLMIEAIQVGCGGEVFVMKMPVVRVADLLEVLVDLVAPVYGFDPSEIEIRETGARPGEKFYEELINDEEIRRTVELENMFAVLPAFRNIYNSVKFDYSNVKSRQIDREYNSQQESPIDHDEIRRLLLHPDVLPTNVSARFKDEGHIREVPLAVAKVLAGTVIVPAPRKGNGQIAQALSTTDDAAAQEG